MPNTFTMQELVRTAVDEYWEDMDNNIVVDEPVIFTIPKGNSVSSSIR
jgi:hypothetical protein